MLGGVISADFETDRGLLVATQDGNDLNLWQSNDGGQTWRNVLNERRLATAPQLVLTSQLSAVSVGNVCYVNLGAGWQQQVLDDAAAPIMVLSSLGGQTLLAISVDHVHRFDGVTWHTISNIESTAVVALLHQSARSQTMALTYEGQVLKGS